MSVAALHRAFKETFATIPAGSIEDGTHAFVPHPIADISYDLFRYYLQKLETKKTQEIARIGRTKFTKDRRILTGTARDNVQHPGQQYVIDATVADVYLVNACNRKVLIGRPTIYVVIDAFSSLILAVHVAMEDACLEQAQVALFRAMAPKDVLVAQLGLPEAVAANLPQGCKPTSLLADRGELLSKGGLALAQKSGMALALAAPYRADWKSLVERYFGVQNEIVLHWLPGAVRKRAQERGDRDVRHDAVLTINGLLRLLLGLAAEWNATHDMSKHISTTMLRKEIDATPISLWKYGLEDLHGSPKSLTRDEAVRQYLPSIEAKCNRLGLLTLENLRFTADWMTDDDAFYDQTAVARAHLILDPDRPLIAFYSEPGTHELREVRLVDNRGYDESDIDVHDIRDTEALVQLNGKEFVEGSKGMKRALAGFRSNVTRDETDLTAAAKDGDQRSNTARVRGIKENKKDTLLGVLGLPNAASSPRPARKAQPPSASNNWAHGMSDVFGDEGIST